MIKPELIMMNSNAIFGLNNLKNGVKKLKQNKTS
jgi:hypothetical protein